MYACSSSSCVYRAIFDATSPRTCRALACLLSSDMPTSPLLANIGQQHRYYLDSASPSFLSFFPVSSPFRSHRVLRPPSARLRASCPPSAFVTYLLPFSPFPCPPRPRLPFRPPPFPPCHHRVLTPPRFLPPRRIYILLSPLIFSPLPVSLHPRLVGLHLPRPPRHHCVLNVDAAQDTRARRAWQEQTQDEVPEGAAGIL
ncbi:hypothetical protein B0H14DRAFT_3457188 [Mycena olivaceomarginata]|nr:hypothetical protein B0H14DRAFT_3457188 [Mycena olivaceomarginata]